jgi:hypothetical protein
MRHSLSLLVLVFAALLCLSAGGVQAGWLFGPADYSADYTNQSPNRSQNFFGYGSDSHGHARPQRSRYRLFHRGKGSANDRVPANAMSGYGMPPIYGTPPEYLQTPIVQPPMRTPAVHMTSVAPAPLPLAPAVQSPPCMKCGQSGTLPTLAPTVPAVQSRIVPVPAPMPAVPTTAEPPPADPTR